MYVFVPVVPMASDGGGVDGSSPVVISYSINSAERGGRHFLCFFSAAGGSSTVLLFSGAENYLL